MKYLEYLREINTVSLLLRYILAMVCSGVVGIEREQKHRPAGFRTHMLVCIGSVTTVLVSLYLADRGYYTDVTRLGASVVSGIGFLGTGTILVTGRHHISGLTTAAGLWASSCIGLAIGAGFYEIALLGTVMILIISASLQRIGKSVLETSRYLRLYIELRELSDIGTLLHEFRRLGISVRNIDTQHSDQKSVTAVLCELESSQNTEHNKIIQSIRDIDGVESVEEL